MRIHKRCRGLGGNLVIKHIFLQKNNNERTEKNILMQKTDQSDKKKTFAERRRRTKV